MSVKFLFKRKFNTRRFFVGVSIILFFLALLVGALYALSELVNRNREKVAATLQAEIGLPITFDRVKTSWFGLSIGMSIYHVTVFDPTKPIAFIKIGKIKLYPDLSALLMQHKLQFKKIILKGLKLKVGWNDHQSFSILGLGGESIPAVIDYSTFMALLSKQKSIFLEEAEIDWRGPTFTIKQKGSAEFKWIKDHTTDWVLAGEQQLQIREGEILPPTAFKLCAAPNVHAIYLTTEGKIFQSNCHAHVNQQQSWNMACEVEVNNVNLADVRRIYKAKKHDPALLQWFENSLLDGRITEATFKINGALNSLETEGNIAFKDVHFLYKPGWPTIDQMSGFVNVEKNSVIVQLQEGKILGSAIETASAIIEPIGNTAKSPSVHIEGALKSTLSAGALFLKQSPLQQSIGADIEALHPQGQMDLHLQLTIPLAEQNRIQVKGGILVKDGEVEVPETNLVLKQLSGDFHFTEHGIQDSHGNAYLNGEPLSLYINTIKNTANQDTLQVIASGLLSAQVLQTNFSYPWLDTLEGASLFTVTLQDLLNPAEKHHSVQWRITSDLQGMAINLPNFLLGKTANQQRFITLTIDRESAQKQKMALNIKDTLDAKWVMTVVDGQYQFKKGHVVFGGGTSLWQASDIAVAPVWDVDGPFIQGSITLFSKEQDTIDIDLKRLILVKDVFSGKMFTMDLLEKNRFPIAFHCEDFIYSDSHFGEVSFKLLPSSYGYQIKNLLFETSESELSGTGEWHLGKTDSYTVLQGKLVTTNMGNLFEQWGYPSPIREGSGYIQYALNWPKHPFQFEMNILNGHAELKFDKGRILEVNPGLGRILGLLNIASIQRRLKLDFSDLLKKGFVFDTLHGDFNLQAGIASTHDLWIDGPAAKIELAGTANISRKVVDLNMTVIPHLGVGIPLVAAFAAGPAVGAGVWLLDKVTGSPMNKLNQHNYHVTGSWDAPAIQELGIHKKQ